MKKNIKKNYIFNLSYQIFALITPLVVTPYISRVLGSAGIGQYSFSYSIVSYFSLFAAFGFNTYAQREIARCQGDKKEQSKIFWEVFFARLFTVIISLIIYFIILFSNVYEESYRILMLILSINIVSIVFDVTFLFQANEEFGIIAIRNFIIKTIGIFAIIIFVKNESHVWLYTLCQVFILIISNVSLWTRLPKALCKIDIKTLDIKKHFLPSLRLFIPTIAVSVYTMLDKTLIGLMIPGSDQLGNKLSDLENGYYEQSEKLVKMCMTIVTSLGTVMIPRNSKLVADGDYDGFKRNINGAIRFVFFIGIPMAFGLAATAQNISPWFFGPGYEKVPYLMMMFSILIVVIGISNVLGIQYLLPMKEDKKYTIAITAGACVNIVLNIILIPLLWSYGACVATIIAETVVTGVMLVFARKDISFVRLIRNSLKYIISGTVMFFAVYFSQLFIVKSFLNTLILIVEGIAIYFASLFILRDQMFLAYSKKFFYKVLSKFKNHH